MRTAKSARRRPHTSQGPIAICQLLETPLLNCVNYASLVATNAARHRIVAGKNKKLVEFGLRRAQGPDGAMSASRYSCLGGFDGTSNVQAGLLFGLEISGTHAHAYVSSFIDDEVLPDPSLKRADGTVYVVESEREKIHEGRCCCCCC